MFFNSLAFLIFFPVVTALYFVLPHRFRWSLLLLASCIFYMAFVPWYVFILFAIIIIDYVAGILIEKSSGERRKLWLGLSITANIGLLAVFKYYNFASTNINALAQAVDWNYSLPLLKIILPLGLSFHTFQAMSYTIEVYRARQKAERHLGIYALYVLFYPQLVAGPIERPGELLPQLHAAHSFDPDRVSRGLARMLGGFFKKIVIADRSALLVNAVYNHPESFGGFSYIVATIFFAFQIYGDFAGYSDIAIGAAEVMGYRLRENFNRPYFARSIADFWRRWHMSLSSWFRDYVYIPLGGSRVRPFRHYANLVIVFLLSGLWHGAGWTFVVWGALHGLAISLGDATSNLRSRLHTLLRLQLFSRLHILFQVACTFVLVCVTWIFFRSPTMGQAVRMIKSIGALFFSAPQTAMSGWSLSHNLFLDQGSTRFIVTVSAILGLIGAEYLSRRSGLRDFFSRQKFTLRLAAYSFLLWFIIIFGQFGHHQFIYFTF